MTKNSDGDQGIRKVIERMAISIYDVALVSRDSIPLWRLLSFIYSSTTSALDILPCGDDEVKRIAYLYCVENMLLVTLLGDHDGGVASSLFSELCKNGFSSERRVVLCVEYFVEWLVSTGEVLRAADVLTEVERHVTHPHFKMELRSVAMRHLIREGDSK